MGASMSMLCLVNVLTPITFASPSSTSIGLQFARKVQYIGAEEQQEANHPYRSGAIYRPRFLHWIIAEVPKASLERQLYATASVQL